MRPERWQEWLLLGVAYIVSPPSDGARGRFRRVVAAIFRICEWLLVAFALLLIGTAAASVTLRVLAFVLLVLLWAAIIGEAETLSRPDQAGEGRRLLAFVLRCVLALAGAWLTLRFLDALTLRFLLGLRAALLQPAGNPAP